MGFYLGKLATQVIYPLPLSILLALVALLLLWRKQHRTAGMVLATSVAILWASSTQVVALALGNSLDRQFPPILPADLPEAGAIVVLGGGLRMPVSPELWSDLGSGSDRMLHAARVYHAGKAPFIVASGGGMPWSRSQDVAANGMADLLVEWGVPRSAILIEPDSRNTYENALRTKLLLDANEIEEVLLVTTAMHMPRALAVFRSAGIRSHPAATDYKALSDPSGTFLSWVPSVINLGMTEAVIKEYLGHAVYRLRGWIRDEG
jgi:uncharacterized SAM-binding protein YcdF (DUF218 family)